MQRGCDHPSSWLRPLSMSCVSGAVKGPSCLAEPVPKTKRLPVAPREGAMLTDIKMETITAIPYDIIKEGLQ